MIFDFFDAYFNPERRRSEHKSTFYCRLVDAGEEIAVDSTADVHELDAVDTRLPFQVRDVTAYFISIFGIF